MPLSEPAGREQIHTREISLKGYRRSDGLWDIEGHLTDVKSYAFTTEQRGRLEPGDPIHDLWIRLTVDDRFTVHAVETATDKAPFTGCGGITPNFQRLVGLSIGKGWTRAVKERLGGVHGCTHLAELLGPVATTAFQTIYPILARERAEREQAGREAAEKDKGTEAEFGAKPGPGPRPVLIDTCHMFASDGEIVRKAWPEHYTGPDRAPRQAAE